jgi:hypothetical protein
MRKAIYEPWSLKHLITLHVNLDYSTVTLLARFLG